jgi:flagellar basal-body rod protein FlgF
VERGLFTAASGMLADQLRQDVIANNLANATTPGYKGDRAVGEAFNSLLLSKVGGGTIGSLGLGSRIAGVVTDSTQGSLRNTQNTYDLGIAGDGFFAVQAKGGVRYTRDGAFTLNQQGQLVTANAEPVLGTNGQPIAIGTAGGKPTIDAQGNVIVGGRTVGTLQVAVLDPKSLQKQGSDLYTGTVQQNAQRGAVQQGYLEQSNVNSVREMVDLISTMRSFESSQKTVQALDETLGKAVNDVGKV